MGLSARQEKFCVEYAKTANAAGSYKNAGYKVTNDRSAASAANRLLQNVDIKSRIVELSNEARKAEIADIAEIQQFLSKAMRGEIDEEQIVVEGCGDGISQAVTRTRKSQLRDRVRAGEILAKMRGGFDNTINVNIAVPKFGGDDELED